MRTGAGMFDVSHMGEIETSGPDAEAFLQRVLSNDVTKIAERGAQYSRALPRGRRRARRPLHLPPRPAARLPHGHQRVEPREGPRLVPGAGRGLRASRSRDAHADYAMLALQGPDARAIVRRALPTARSPTRMRTPTLARWRASTACVCGTGYTGEDGVELLIPPDGATAVWDALLDAGVTPGGPRRPRHAAPRGLLPPLRQRPLRGPQPDRGRPRLVLQARHGLHRLRRAARRRARADARPVRLHRPGHPAPGQPGRIDAAMAWSRAGRCRPASRSASAWRTFPSAAAEPGTPIEVDVRGKLRARRGAEEAPVRKKESQRVAERATPRT